MFDGSLRGAVDGRLVLFGQPVRVLLHDAVEDINASVGVNLLILARPSNDVARVFQQAAEVGERKHGGELAKERYIFHQDGEHNQVKAECLLRAFQFGSGAAVAQELYPLFEHGRL